MSNGLLLWIDDEIEMLRSHIIFLEKKGYDVKTVTNGTDAIEMCRKETFDLILLDEMMPGMSGLETLQQIKAIQSTTPVVMVTKSEEENLMEQAIGSKIADYLIKPVNPNQILIALKKNIHRKELVAEFTQSGYQQSFMEIADKTDHCTSWNDWVALYQQLVHWEIELSMANSNMVGILQRQKDDANKAFFKYIKANYSTWIQHKLNAQKASHIVGYKDRNTPLCNNDCPLISSEIMSKKVFPLLDKGRKIFMIVIDNFRWDQWQILAEELSDMFEISEEAYLSILPTATQYARNAIFSGLLPAKVKEMFPELWIDENEEGSKNINEEPLIKTQLDRYRRHETFSYNKINDSVAGEKLMNHLSTLNDIDLNVVVINFIDMLSHARTESKMVRELANDEAAYRSITLSWFKHSVLSELFKYLSRNKFTVILTTDHGSIRVNKPIKIIGDRETNTNLRYKLGRNLTCTDKDVFTIKEPQMVGLPRPNISTAYMFAPPWAYFAYPNNFNHYVSYYNNTFQHGGISMEEMIVPIATLRPRHSEESL